MKYSPELKLKALGLIANDTDLKDIVAQLGVTYPTLLNWRKELNKGIENGNLASIIDAEEALIHGVAEQLAEDLIKLDPSQAESIEGELLPVVEGADGYNALSVELQRVATKLAKKISAAADSSVGPDSLESLTNSLAKLQEAFFNKNVTQVAVFGGGNQGSSTTVSKFKGLQKS